MTYILGLPVRDAYYNCKRLLVIGEDFEMYQNRSSVIIERDIHFGLSPGSGIIDVSRPWVGLQAYMRIRYEEEFDTHDFDEETSEPDVRLFLPTSLYNDEDHFPDHHFTGLHGKIKYFYTRFHELGIYRKKTLFHPNKKPEQHVRVTEKIYRENPNNRSLAKAVTRALEEIRDYAQEEGITPLKRIPSYCIPV